MSNTAGQRESQASIVPARATQGAESHGRDWSWVEATVWSERMLAALENGVKGGKWFSLIDKVYREETLKGAWHKVKDNAGAAGVDGQSVEQFKARAELYLEELERALRTREYRPQPIKRVEIPKGGGKKRPLGIPAVKDRIVQTAVKLVIEPIFEREFEESSYGFRPGRGCKDALREVDELITEGYSHVVDADMESYFDSIAHAELMQRIEERISDGAVLELIGAFLNQDIIQGMKRWTAVGGTPQGAVLSPLLANIYLHPLDRRMKQQGYRMVRYADDFVVLCRSGEQAQAALREVRAWVEQNGLKLNGDKTQVGDCRQAGQGFEFLGYRFEAGRRWVRKKSLLALRERIRQKTRRTRGESLACIIADLNPVLRGWFHYFKHTQPWVHQLTDSFVRRRLRAILRQQDKGPGMGKCRDDHLQWPNSFFAAATVSGLRPTTMKDEAMKSRSFNSRSGQTLVAALWLSFVGLPAIFGFACAAEAKPSWQTAWENTVAAAKKEGRLNFYVGRYGSEPLLNEFRKEFPEIKIASVNGTGNSLGTRIVAESRAGSVIADLYSGGAVTNFEILYKGKVLDSLKSALILPEVLDESKWHGGKHRYNDPEQQHVFIYLANPTSSSVYFNTNLVNPKDFKSYWDLVNPKWKGKYVSQEPTGTGIGPSLQFFFYHPDLGPDFLRKLFIDQQVVYSRDRRQMTDWLAQGKFALCLGCRDSDKARKQGLPVDEMDMVDWKEGSAISPGGGSMSLIKGAPHPNAAKVFINWFLSRRGQIALQKYDDLYGQEPPNSRRTDIPKDMLPASSRLVEGRRYFDFTDPKYADMTPIYQLAKEFMKGRESK